MRLLPMTSGPHPARRKMSLGAHPRTSSFIAYAMNAWFHVILFSVHASTASRPHRYCPFLGVEWLVAWPCLHFFHCSVLFAGRAHMRQGSDVEFSLDDGVAAVRPVIGFVQLPGLLLASVKRVLFHEGQSAHAATHQA